MRRRWRGWGWVTFSAALLTWRRGWVSPVGFRGAGWRRLAAWWGVWRSISVRERPAVGPRIARRTTDLIADRCPILIQMPAGAGLSVPSEERGRRAGLRPRMAALNPCSMSLGEGESSNPPTAVRRIAARMRQLGSGLSWRSTAPASSKRACGSQLTGCSPDRYSSASWLGCTAGWRRHRRTLSSWSAGCRRERSGRSSRSAGPACLTPPLAWRRAGTPGRVRTDTLHLRRGELRPGIRPLAKRAVILARDPGLPIAGVAEAERDLGIAS